MQVPRCTNDRYKGKAINKKCS